LELQRCPVSCHWQVHVGPFAVVVIQLSRIVSTPGPKPEAAGKTRKEELIYPINTFLSITFLLCFFSLHPVEAKPQRHHSTRQPPASTGPRQTT
jgi:hypothetical protein